MWLCLAGALIEKIVDKSFVITVLCLIWVLFATMMLLVINNGRYPFIDIWFEVVSGFGTVGFGYWHYARLAAALANGF